MKYYLRLLPFTIFFIVNTENASSQIKMAPFTFNHYYSINNLPLNTEKLLNKHIDFHLKTDSLPVTIDNKIVYFKRRKFRSNPHSGKQLVFFIPKRLYERNDSRSFTFIEKSKIIEITKDYIKCKGKVSTEADNKTKSEIKDFYIQIRDLSGIVIGL